MRAGLLGVLAGFYTDQRHAEGSLGVADLKHSIVLYGDMP
jgi:hypothetical protein